MFLGQRVIFACITRACFPLSSSRGSSAALVDSLEDAKNSSGDLSCSQALHRIGIHRWAVHYQSEQKRMRQLITVSHQAFINILILTVIDRISPLGMFVDYLRPLDSPLKHLTLNILPKRCTITNGSSDLKVSLQQDQMKIWWMVLHKGFHGCNVSGSLAYLQWLWWIGGVMDHLSGLLQDYDASGDCS